MALKYSLGVEMRARCPKTTSSTSSCAGRGERWGRRVSGGPPPKGHSRERETGEGRREKKRGRIRRARAGRAGAYRDVRDVRLRRVARAPTCLLVLFDARRIFERLAFPGGGRRVHSTRGAQHRPSPHPSRRREQSTCFQFARDLDSRHARHTERHRSRARDGTHIPHSPSHDTHDPRTPASTPRRSAPRDARPSLFPPLRNDKRQFSNPRANAASRNGGRRTLGIRVRYFRVETINSRIHRLRRRNPITTKSARRAERTFWRGTDVDCRSKKIFQPRRVRLS